MLNELLPFRLPPATFAALSLEASVMALWHCVLCTSDGDPASSQAPAYGVQAGALSAVLVVCKQEQEPARGSVRPALIAAGLQAA